MIAKDDIYPAPSFVGAVPPSEASLRPLLESEPDKLGVWFALGNFFLREGRFADAITAFENAIQNGNPTLELLTNFGVALREAQRPDDAVQQFRQAILLGGDSFLPNYHLGLTLAGLGELSAARSALERALRNNPQHSKLQLELARLVESSDGLGAAVSYYEDALRLQPNQREVREHLARREFEIGDAFFAEGKLDEAFHTWWKATQQYAPAFITSQELNSRLFARVKDFRKTFRPRIQLRGYRQVCDNPEKLPSFAHPMFSRFLFTLGLLPEFYEPKETLDQEALRWNKSLADEGEHPYPHFRLTLIHAYKGEMEAALKEIRICQDRLLPKKQASLRVGKILAFLSELVEVKNRATHMSQAAAGTSEWEQAGFSDPFQSEAWRKSGLEPFVAKEWKEANFSPKQAVGWTKIEVSAAAASAWVKAGYESAKQARDWVRGGLSPQNAQDWEKAFPGDAAAAVQWFKAGFTEPDEAAKWAALVLFPWDAMRWIENGFDWDETNAFYERGIKDTYQAARERKRDAN